MRKTQIPPKPKRGAGKAAGVGVIYARFSSHRQNEMSIDQQVETCQRLAADLGIEIATVYADRALTGTNDRRPDFQRMMRDAAKGLFSYVIAWKSNRIGRNMLEALVNEEKLLEDGVRIVYVEEDFDDTAAGRFAARNMMNVNQFYSEAMAEDIRRGLQDNAKKCKVNGSIPIGYKKAADGRYAVDEKRAEIVREIFRRVAAGEAQADIIADLNRRKMKTALGREFGKCSFHSILKNERYRGIYVFGETRIEGGIPRIIDDGLFFRVQEVIEVKKHVKGRHVPNGDYLLTGKLFCGECKEHMIGVSGTGKSGVRHYYYACSRKRTKKDCKKKDVRRDYIENAVAKALQDVILHDDVAEWIADVWESYAKKSNADGELALLEEEKKTAEASIRNLMTAIEHGVISETMTARLRELETEKKHLERQILTLRSKQITVTREEILDWLDGLRRGDPFDKAYQKQLFDLLLIAAYVYDDGRVRVVFTVGDGEKSVDLDVIEDGEGDGGEECSFNLSKAPPKESQANTSAIRFVDGFFAFDFRLF